MGKEFGKNWRIAVGDGAGPEVFTEIAGEVSFDWSRSSKEIDTSSKDDGAYATIGYGRQSVSISVSGKLTLPDADGLERVAEVSKSATPQCNFKIMKGAAVKFAGTMSIGNLSTTHADDEVCTYKFDLKTAAAPTTDDLGA
jgi:predicted secreted protein